MSEPRIEERNGWRIVTRGSPTPTVAAEYVCPEHGRFAVDVERDHRGEAPAIYPCPTWVEIKPSCLGVAGYLCTIAAPFTMSAPLAKVKFIEVERGGWERPALPTYTDTRNLGEGQDLDDWRADRAKVWERDREQAVMDLRKELG